ACGLVRVNDRVIGADWDVVLFGHRPRRVNAAGLSDWCRWGDGWLVAGESLRTVVRPGARSGGPMLGPGFGRGRIAGPGACRSCGRSTLSPGEPRVPLRG